MANDDPYEKGWLLILKPDDWDSVKGSLVVGSEVTAAYEAKMDSEGFGGCE
jgi:glycine cleavage system H protein